MHKKLAQATVPTAMLLLKCNSTNNQALRLRAVVFSIQTKKRLEKSGNKTTKSMPVQ